MATLKLCVEVVSAHKLMAKDGQGSSNPYLELHFDGKKLQSTVKEKNLDPVWNESFYFSIPDPAILRTLALDAYIYNNNAKEAQSRSFLGKVTINGASFASSSDAVVLHYPLEKRGVFSRVRGELALRVFVTDDPSIKPSTCSSETKQSEEVPAFSSEAKKSEEVPAESIKKSETKHQTFHALLMPDVSDGELHQATKYVVGAMKAPEPAFPNVVKMNSTAPIQPVDFALKETSPLLGGSHVDRAFIGTYDLVEKMQYLFARVVKAKDLPSTDVDPYVEVRIGNYKGVTKHFEKQPNPVWNMVFAFARERIQATVVEVEVKDKANLKDDFIGVVRFDFNEVLVRVPPDGPLAPEWYCLMDKKGDKIKSDLMLSVWIGTQADEAFPDACHTDAASSIDSTAAASTLIRSKVYHAPRLWYVRVSIIEAQDMIPQDNTRIADCYVKAQLGNQLMKTRPNQARNFNPIWNEDLVFVTAEPFEDPLILSVEDRVAPGKDETIGKISISLNMVPKRADDRILPSRWFNLEKPVAPGNDQPKESKFSSRIHLRVCLDGGYHVLDESTHYSSDLHPAAKHLWKKAIGVLELGILNAAGLQPMKTRDGKGTSDTYCVAKYGSKWVRTRTVMDNLFPKYNEQYIWEVFDPATVLTVGVFDNNQLSSNEHDAKIGKVRVRISTLQTGRVYTHSYPLLVLNQSGVKKMGELHLAIRFSCTSFVNMLHVYSTPLLPKMHYIMPFSMMQLEILRHQAVNIVATRLARAEPPLRKEIVEYMCDADSHLWSMRKSKANFFRLTLIFTGVIAAGNWFRDICLWKNPITTVLVHALYLMLISFPDLILPTIFLYMFLIGIWNFRFRPRHPPHMNTKISQAEIVHQDELDEEFDTFPTNRNPDMVKMRYDRLRSVAGRIQTVVGDIATQGERLQSILSWRDPRATTIFLGFCIAAALILYVTPFQIVSGLAGLFVMRHPKFRHPLPSAAVNFFRRLPARTDGDGKSRCKAPVIVGKVCLKAFKLVLDGLCLKMTIICELQGTPRCTV